MGYERSAVLNPGKKFEHYFAKSIPENVYFLRIKDSASSFSPNSKSRFTSNNPYDFLIFANGHLLPLELKSTKSKSLSIQRSKDEPTKEIKYHQIMALADANKFDNIISGFVFDFRNDGTYWMYIQDFLNFLENSNKKSINIKDVKNYNGFEIQRKKMITNYRYDIMDMLVHILGTRDESGKKNSL